MLTIGLTGPSGAGKGTVASLFAPYGILSIDTDKVYHDLLIPPSSCLDELTTRFGPKILNPDGTLDRKALASHVFAKGNEEELADLNRITHAFVLDVTRSICRELEAKGCVGVFVDAPLLFESGFDTECHTTLAVLADPDVRLARIMARDSLTLSQAQARLSAQKPDGYYVERAAHVIYNNSTTEALFPEIQRLLTLWGVTS
ncbi:MAG: dephospho-CoA kinase [Ruminococcaceae bacterium]|nr:dephospho-CoA kinase [Oscillospiraceae bacterium]